MEKAEDVLEDTFSNNACDWIDCVRVAKWAFRKAVGAYLAGGIDRKELEARHRRLISIGYLAVQNSRDDQAQQAIDYYLDILLYLPHHRIRRDRIGI